MDRYQIQLATARKYEIHDTKHGDAVVAMFYDFDLAKQVIEYLNHKERLVDLMMKQASEDIDYEFQE